MHCTWGIVYIVQHGWAADLTDHIVKLKCNETMCIQNIPTGGPRIAWENVVNNPFAMIYF